MSGGSKTETKHEVSSNQLDPMQMAQYQGNYTGAQDRFSSLQPYTGPLTAGFNPTQTQAQGILGNIATDPSYQANNNSAIGSVQGVLGQNINSNITPQTYDAAQLSNTDLSPYMNPFQKNVIDASLAQNEFARNQAQVHDQQAATRAGSFQGAGTRQGVAMGETNAGYDRNNQQNLATLNTANFGQAQNAAQSDIAARNQGSQFNINNNMNAQQSSFANALAAQGLKLNAAGQLEQLNNNGLNIATQQGGILSAIGDTQQAQEQRGYTDQYNAYLQEFNRRLAEQQALNQALGIIPLQQTQTSDGTNTTKSSPGAMGILGGIAGLGMSAATLGTGGGLTSGLGGLFGSTMAGNPAAMPSPFGTINYTTPTLKVPGIFG